jgi:hypothetical protein
MGFACCTGASEDQPSAVIEWKLNKGQRQYCLIGAGPFMSRYAGHTITGMSAVPGSTQLTLHLQSPAAAAAAQQAADAAAAAVEADPAAWKEHQVGGESITTARHACTVGNYFTYKVINLADCHAFRRQQPLIA